MYWNQVRWPWVLRIHFPNATEPYWLLHSKFQHDNLVQGQCGGEASTLRPKSQINPWIKNQAYAWFLGCPIMGATVLMVSFCHNDRGNMTLFVGSAIYGYFVALEFNTEKIWSRRWSQFSTSHSPSSIKSWCKVGRDSPSVLLFLMDYNSPIAHPWRGTLGYIKRGTLCSLYHPLIAQGLIYILSSRLP